MYTSIFAKVHVTPITINHAQELTTTWPSGISQRARVPGTKRSKIPFSVFSQTGGDIVGCPGVATWHIDKCKVKAQQARSSAPTPT
jgi:hypothetical protein